MAAQVDVAALLGVLEAHVLGCGAEPAAEGVHQGRELGGRGSLHAHRVELWRVAADDVHVVALLVHLRGVQVRYDEEGRVHEAAALLRQVLLAEVEQRVQRHHDRVLVAVTVPALGGVPVGVGVAVTDLAPPDEAADDGGAGVGRQPQYDVADELVPVVDAVVGLQLVEVAELVVEELCGIDEVVAARLGEHHVLDHELQHLVLPRQRLPLYVDDVPHLPQLLHGHPHLPRLEVGEGYVREVEAEGAVLENAEVVPGAEDALAEVLRHATLVHEPLDALDPIRDHAADVPARVLKLLPKIDLRPVVANCVCVARGARVAVGEPLAARALLLHHRDGATVPAESRPGRVATLWAVQPHQLDPYPVASLGPCNVSLGAAGVADGEDGVDIGAHLPLLRLLGPPHAGAHVDVGFLLDREA